MPSTGGFSNIARALRNPNYGTFSLGNAVSQTGTWMQRVGVAWLTWELTGSGWWLGLIAFADFFPVVVVAPFAGATADRWDRLRLVRITQTLFLLQALALLATALAGGLSVELLFAMTLLGGVTMAFDQPARLSLVSTMVPRPELPAAVAVNSMIFNMARIVGPAIAGPVLLMGGAEAVFAANAASYAIFVAALMRVRSLAAASGPAPARQGLLREVTDGIRYTVRHPGLFPMMFLLVIVSTFARPVFEMLPAFTDALIAGGVVATSATGLAVLTSSAGFGAVLGGLWLAQRSAEGDFTRFILVNGLIAAVGLLLFVMTGSVWVMLPSIIAASCGVTVSGIGTQTLIQLVVDGHMRGRVTSLYGMIFRGCPAIGAIAAGAVSEYFGMRWPLAVGALATFAAWCWLWRRRRQVAAAVALPQAVPEQLPDAALTPNQG